MIVSGNNPQYLARVIQIAENLKQNGSRPLIIDVSCFNPNLGNSYPARLLKSFCLTSPTKNFHAYLKSNSIEFLSPDKLSSSTNISSNIQGDIESAAESAIISYTRDANFNLRVRRNYKLWQQLVQGGEHTYQYLKEIARSVVFESIYIPNGRFPYQRAAESLAFELEIPVTYFEKGDYSDSLYLHPYSALDREASQKDVDILLADFSEDLIHQVGNKWFASRQPSGTEEPENIYALNFSSAPLLDTSTSDSDGQFVGIFTSSQDEFASLGPSWHIHEWKNQYQAIREVLDFIGTNQPTFLRIHPNLATKSHNAYVLELAEIEALQSDFPNLQIYMHDAPVNSYELIKRCSKVIVWDSTIGLESVYLGVPTYELAASYYDNYISVTTLFSHNDLAKLDIDVQQSIDKAVRFAAYLVLREFPLEEKTINLVREFDLPGGFRKFLLATLSSGGNPTVGFFLRQMLDTVRHRSLRTNSKFLSRFLRRSMTK